MNHPEPEKAFDAPLYFKRRWPPKMREAPEQPPLLPPGFDLAIVLSADEEFWIYGYSCRSNYPEDLSVEQRTWRESQSFMSVCFSVAEPRGEIGFTPAHWVEEISQEDFEAAQARNWKP